MDRPNLAVLSNAFVRRVIIDRKRATGVEGSFCGQVREFTAGAEVRAHFRLRACRYLRDAALSFWHHVGTAKMGHDPMAVVDGCLKVYGIERLRIADGSVMPRITAGNTMAPCLVIGERAAEEMKDEYRLGEDTVSL